LGDDNDDDLVINQLMRRLEELMDENGEDVKIEMSKVICKILSHTTKNGLPGDMELSGQLITRLVQQVSDMTINNSFDKFTS
jgi:hypothetical protein